MVVDGVGTETTTADDITYPGVQTIAEGAPLQGGEGLTHTVGAIWSTKVS